MRRSLSLFTLGLLLLAVPLIAAPGIRGDSPRAELPSSLLFPLDASLADGHSHHLVVRVMLEARELHHEGYVFTVDAQRLLLPLLLEGATRETITTLERDHPRAMRVVMQIDDRTPVELTFADLLLRDAKARAGSLSLVSGYALDSQRKPAARPAARPNLRLQTNDQMCPNSSYCMDDYWECKGGHGDNEGNEYCDFALYECQFGQHYTREVRTNDQYSFAFALEVCAHDGFWEAFNPHIYLQGSHSYTDQVWDDWYCHGSLVSSTLVSSTNGSETCYHQTSQECEIGTAEDISGECTH